MDFETYREWTRETAVYPKDIEEQYLLLGLANERTTWRWCYVRR